MKELELFSIGSWTIFDHLLRMKRLPRDGETVPLDMPMEEVETIHFGDCSANIAAVAGALGMKVGLGMVVGDDFRSSGYADHMTRNGVDLAGVEVIEGARSGHSFNFFDAANGGFCVSHLGVAEKQDDWRTPYGEIDRSGAVVISEMFGAYTLNAIEHARKTGALTAINGMVATAGDLAPRFLEACEVLFLSRGEADALMQALGVASAADILAHGPRLVIVTRGGEGSAWYTADGRQDMPSVAPDAFVDSTGAGDSFVAGTLKGLIGGHSHETAARIGATVASFIIEKWGCQSNLPSPQRVAQRFEANFGRKLSL
ncbi:carbohydrate kinase family protein [Mesorhizobium sp. NZP2298]|uniref:carbohydrate kinase family protein n=1 Tax=Mesorhizobium sp. NZP2298 TaxID=2483403 RepID=UPI0015544CDF|nr:carbohydrate kinase family protein [Mesorhizobium sp. NZP2298]QKC98545.1 carbohydrate kinase family protein [Mesorhizobium sp. NZP2298]